MTLNMTFILIALLPPFAIAQPSAAQLAVPLTEEHHHHLVFTDARVRVFDVHVAPHTATLLHEHDHDYVWVALGDSEISNAPLGGTKTHQKVSDASVHYAPGPLTHVAGNEGNTEFHNVTIELLAPQTNPQNLCDQVIGGQPAECSGETAASKSDWKGAEVRPEFATDQMRASIVRIDPGSTLTIAASVSPLLVALEGTQAEYVLRERSGGRSAPRIVRPTSVLAPAGAICEIHNTGKSVARFLAIEFTEPQLAQRSR